MESNTPKPFSGIVRFCPAGWEAARGRLSWERRSLHPVPDFSAAFLGEPRLYPSCWLSQARPDAPGSAACPCTQQHPLRGTAAPTTQSCPPRHPPLCISYTKGGPVEQMGTSVPRAENISLQRQWFSPRGWFLSPWRHLYWHLVGRGQGCC